MFYFKIFLLLIYSSVLKIQFLDPYINFMFNLLVNSLNLTNVSINSILGSSFSFLIVLILCLIHLNLHSIVSISLSVDFNSEFNYYILFVFFLALFSFFSDIFISSFTFAPNSFISNSSRLLHFFNI